MRDGEPIFDADAHVMEPVDLWWSHLDPALRGELAPDPRLGDTYGRLLPLVGGAPTYLGSGMMTAYLASGAASKAIAERFGSIALRGFSPAAVCEAMDAEGIDVAAVYPSFGLHVPYAQHLSGPLALGLARAYNRWIGSYAAESGGRIAAVALAPLHDPDGAAAEIRRAVAQDGARAIMLRPNPIHGRPLQHPAHEPVFRAIVESGAAAILHEGRGGNVVFTGSDRFDTWYASRAASHPMEAMLAFAGLVVDGVLDRFPSLRLGFLESSTGWLPWWLDRLDEHHEQWAASERPGLALRPSEYFQRQCVISGETGDRFLPAVVAALGAERVMWASDFPHMECRWPGSLAGLLESTPLSPAQRRQLLWDTPARLYGVGARP